MIEFTKLPPQKPGDVLLTESGAALLAQGMGPRTVNTVFGERPEKPDETGKRLLLIGNVVGDIILANMTEIDRQDPLLVNLIMSDVACQWRNRLAVDNEGTLTDEARGAARYFAAGLAGFETASATHEEALV